MASNPAAALPAAAPDSTAGDQLQVLPGRLPSPAPATIYPVPPAAQVTDASGQLVGVSGRRVVSDAPANLAVAGHPAQPVVAWAGPWIDDDYAWARRPGAAEPAASWSPPTAPPGCWP